MASGDPLVGEDGTPMVDADGLPKVDNGAGNDCCCSGLPCLSDNPCSLCLGAGNCTPRTMEVVFDGITLKGGCYFDGSFDINITGNLTGPYTLTQCANDACKWSVVLTDVLTVALHNAAGGTCTGTISGYTNKVKIDLTTDGTSWFLKAAIFFDIFGELNCENFVTSDRFYNDLENYLFEAEILLPVSPCQTVLEFTQAPFDPVINLTTGAGGTATVTPCICACPETCGSFAGSYVVAWSGSPGSCFGVPADDISSAVVEAESSFLHTCYWKKESPATLTSLYPFTFPLDPSKKYTLVELYYDGTNYTVDISLADLFAGGTSSVWRGTRPCLNGIRGVYTATATQCNPGDNTITAVSVS